MKDNKLSLERLYRRMDLETVSAAQLAEKVGISRQAMYNIINGKSQPKPATLEKMCEALNCKPAQLFGPDEMESDHAHFADVLVARLDREIFDVKATVKEYVDNWLVEHYDDLDYEQFKAAKEYIDDEGEFFAKNMNDLLIASRFLDVDRDLQEKVAEQAFILFFEVTTSMLDLKIGAFDPDFDKFEGMPDE